MSKNLSIRAGPSWDEEELGSFPKMATHSLNLHKAEDCWILFSFQDKGNTIKGWSNSKEMNFSYQNKLKMPNEAHSRVLSRKEIINETSRSTYMIKSIDFNSGRSFEGNAVAISSEVLLTNCHVIIKREKNIFIVINCQFYPGLSVKGCS